MKWSIYKITVNNLSYIGVTIQPDIRKSQHINDAKRNRTNSILHEELRKSHFNFHFEIIHSNIASTEEAMSLEANYIKQHNTKYPHGLNMTDGGEGTPGWFPNDNTKEKISETLRKYFQDENNRKRNSDAVKRALAEMPEDKKKKMLANRLKACRDPIRRKKQSDALKRHFTEDQREKEAIRRGSKSFIVHDLDGNFIGEWTNKTKCASELGINRANMRKVLNGENTHTKGYVLRYKDENIDN